MFKDLSVLPRCRYAWFRHMSTTKEEGKTDPRSSFRIFSQHVHAPEEGLSILGLRQQQNLLDALQQQLADGCHLTRETGRLIKDSVGGPPSR